jgi:excisionase family DNA binding protein
MQSQESTETITIITADEAAALLGIHRQSLYEAAGRGEIPCRRVGRRYIFVREHLIEWLRAGAPVAHH